MTALKIGLFRVARALGLFRLSRYLMRRRVLILCFHGIALDDEAQFRPKLFIEKSRLRRRLETIRNSGAKVVPLDTALSGLATGGHPDNSVVITIDDGFYSTLSEAAPMLREFDMPATLYLTTYYAQKETPIFRLAVQYLFWKAGPIQSCTFDFEGRLRITLSSQDTREQQTAMWRIVEFGEQQCDEAGRQALCRALGNCLGLDYEEIARSRRFNLVRLDELTQLRDAGVDIQLHTHRHRFPPEDLDVCRLELNENQTLLTQAGFPRRRHFCYPSGVWSAKTWQCLEEAGIISAVTTDVGLNTPETPKYRLYRFLDKNDLSDIEFEAELYGFAELLRLVSFRRKRQDAEHHSWHLDSSLGKSGAEPPVELR